MNTLGTALTPTANRILLLGSGELGKELAIEALRLGIEVIAVDRYANAPAMHVAQHSEVIDMQNADAIQTLAEKYQPDFIVPEIEAIATEALLNLEQQGFTVVPNAKAVHATMDRQRIRDLAAQTCGLPTANYRYASSEIDYFTALDTIGLPCVVKPIRSSSGKGQSICKTEQEAQSAWAYAQANARGESHSVIVEELLDFDYEITLLTIAHQGGITCAAPIGHIQKSGDYQQSWQPHPMPVTVLNAAEDIAKAIVAELGGLGLFGVELFIKDEMIYFNEVSPRPHDTGLVTLASQSESEFSLHLRALLGLPIPSAIPCQPAASVALLAKGQGQNIQVKGLENALSYPETKVYLFGKGEINGSRRLGVVTAKGDSIEQAKHIAETASGHLDFEIN